MSAATVGAFDDLSFDERLLVAVIEQRFRCFAAAGYEPGWAARLAVDMSVPAPPRGARRLWPLDPGIAGGGKRVPGRLV